MWKWPILVGHASDDLVFPLTNHEAFRVAIEDGPGHAFSQYHEKPLAKPRLDVRENDVGSG